jgi:hypothetical protein
MAKGKGRPSSFKPEFVEQARKLCKLGATDRELADFFGVAESTINNWKVEHPDFLESLKRGKDEADGRVEQSLYRRALGYSHDAVHVSNWQGEVTLTPIVEHYPPDTTACIFWLKNRKPAEWRDMSKLDLTNSDASITKLFAAAVHAANGMTVEAPAQTGGESTRH